MKMTGETGVISCKHVADGRRACLLVTHHDDGDWSFSCGNSDHGDDYVFIHLHHLTDVDDSVRGALEIPLGWLAERADPSSPWVMEEDVEDPLG
jgi:hypothetical protein